MMVDMSKYKNKREKNKMCKEILKEIKEKRRDGVVYRTDEMEYIADRILRETQNSETTIIPVVEIAKKMDFSTYQRNLWWFLSGSIAINKKYKKKYNTDHVIFTNRKVHPYQQRFVIAHELAHFLFDYDHLKQEYYNTYIKNTHNAESERRANTFAANLLMPKEIFIKEYSNALKINPDPVFTMFYLSDKFKAPRKAVIKRISEVLHSDKYNWSIIE